MTKVDVFIPKGDPLSQAQLRRRWFLTIEDGFQLPLFSAEDIILQKLFWYQKGGKSSRNQLRDVIGVIQVRAATLDQTYLQEQAAQSGLEALLLDVLSQGLF